MSFQQMWNNMVSHGLRRLTGLLALVLAPAAFAEESLLPCRVALPPLLVKLKRTGGDPARVVRVQRVADLLALRSGARYKFSQASDRALRVAPAPADEPNNEYSHPVLAQGAPVFTAGGITVVHDGRTLRRVTVDQDSKSYCPTLASLATALAELARLGLGRERMATRDRPPACEPLPDGAPVPRAGSESTRGGAP